MPIDLSAIGAYLQIILINVVLSGDNVVVIGMAAAALSPHQRSKAITIGIAAATAIRVVLAILATKLMAITGLLLAGGLLLLWVCWKMGTELYGSRGGEADDDATASSAAAKTLGQAVTQIIIADVSMSLDNVLAVAGAAKQNLPALVFGLVLSVILMGVAASLVARLLSRYRWIGWLGLAIILYVALGMVWEGGRELTSGGLPHLPFLNG